MPTIAQERITQAVKNKHGKAVLADIERNLDISEGRARTLQKNGFILKANGNKGKARGSIIMTSNKDIPDWKDLFSKIDALECALDRLCNNSISIRFSGLSNRKDASELIEVS